MAFSLLELLAVGVASAVAPAATTLACGGGGTLSYNGICTPARFPPRKNYSRAVPHPDYLSSPPPFINVTVGRQLFVDDFLIQNSSGVSTRFYTAKYYDKNPVLKPDQPWEGTVAMPFSGVSRATGLVLSSAPHAPPHLPDPCLRLPPPRPHQPVLRVATPRPTASA